MSDMRIPKSNYMKGAVARKSEKELLAESFEEYKLLIRDKTHPNNQGDVYNKRVIHTLQKLLVNANNLDEINPGEGIFGLIVLSLRVSLSLKDEITKLEVENRNLKIEMNRLKKR